MSGNTNAPWRDEELLRQKYWEKGLSTAEVAEELGCSKHTIQKWMDRYGIEKRRSNRHKLLSIKTNKHGYEEFSGYSGGEPFSVRVHRLLAVSEGELTPTEFICGEKNVHHKNNVPWDNRPENIEAMSIAEHAKAHDPEREKDSLGRYS